MATFEIWKSDDISDDEIFGDLCTSPESARLLQENGILKGKLVLRFEAVCYCAAREVFNERNGLEEYVPLPDGCGMFECKNKKEV